MAGDDLAAAISGGIESVTGKWAKQRKAEERHANAYLRRRQVMTRVRAVTIKDAAWDHMEAAYLKASAGGTLPANARQIMYAARPLILAATGNQLDDAYFTQVLLPDYIAENRLEQQWDVAYDARGHFTEPHTGAAVSLGTLDVRRYVGDIAVGIDDPLDIGHLELDYPTVGPEHRYSAVLFLEKEGFTPLLRQAHLAERYDLAIMSTKGMSNVAARTLVDHLTTDGVRVFVARDFDKAGFSIAATLTGDTRRYAFTNEVDVVDLGIRLADVHEYGLQPEPVYDRAAAWKVAANLRENGATVEEITFLNGQRVELNAFTSDQFIAWLEAKLDGHDVEKVVPDTETLETAYRRALGRRAVNAKIDEIKAAIREEAAQTTIPDDLTVRVEALLWDDPQMAWDTAVDEIAKQENNQPS
ncbi:MAG TPA: DUF2399 domain-containing protein [Jiangellaceae bacterium]